MHDDDMIAGRLIRPHDIKVCGGPCGRELPMTTDWFERDESKSDGFAGWCKGCRKERRKAQQLAKAAGDLKRFDQMLLKSLASAKPGGTDVPHIAEMYQSLMNLMGGVQGYAIQTVATFMAAKPGSATRQKILASIQQMGMALSDSKKVSMPPELMEDADLVEEIERRSAKLREAGIVSGQAKEVADDDGTVESP